MSNCNDSVPCNGCNDCPTCGCCQETCTCTTPGYDGTGCVETIDTDCIIYNGTPNSCIPIQKTNTLTVIIQKIVAYIKDIFNHITSTSLVITPSSGTCNSDLTIEIEPSTDANNIFVLGSDNYPYVPAPPDSIDDVNILSGECIVWTKTVISGVPTFSCVIDWNCVASHICAINCVSICANPLALTVN